MPKHQSHRVKTHIAIKCQLMETFCPAALYDEYKVQDLTLNCCCSFHWFHSYLWWTQSLIVIVTSLHILEMYHHLHLIAPSRQKKSVSGTGVILFPFLRLVLYFPLHLTGIKAACLEIHPEKKNIKYWKLKIMKETFELLNRSLKSQQWFFQ